MTEMGGRVVQHFFDALRNTDITFGRKTPMELSEGESRAMAFRAASRATNKPDPVPYST